MSEDKSETDILSPQEQLAARWDKVAYQAQGSPFEDLSIACLAKNSGTRAWSRPAAGLRETRSPAMSISALRSYWK